MHAIVSNCVQFEEQNDIFVTAVFLHLGRNRTFLQEHEFLLIIHNASHRTQVSRYS